MIYRILLFVFGVTTLCANPVRSHQLVCVTDDSIFPVYLLSASTVKRDFSHPRFRGDKNSPLFVAINVSAPCDVVVEIKCGRYILPSGGRFHLTEAGDWGLSPLLRPNTEALVGLSEPDTVIADYVVKDASSKAVLASGQKRMRMRSVNDCLFGFIRPDGSYEFKGIFFAAYVNEDHPEIDRYLQLALKNRLVDAFIGYQGDKQAVLKQINAIWQTLQRRGIKYSSITAVSDTSSRIYSQHVRRIDESLRNTQANCVDGTVLMASILRKIGLRTHLILIPGHCFLGVSVSDNDQEIVPIETTAIGNNASLKQAIDLGFSNYIPAREKFGREPGYQQISVNDARAKGIMPLRSPRRTTKSGDLPN